MKSVDQILTKVNTIIAAGITVKLNALETEYADGIVLTDPRDYKIVESSLRNNFPCLETYVMPEAPGEDHTAVSIYVNYDIACRIWVTYNDPEKLVKAVYRHLRALTELVFATTHLENYVNLCSFRGYRFENWEQLENGAYLGGGSLLMEINHMENIRI